MVALSMAFVLLTGARQQPVVYLAAAAITFHYAIRPLTLREVTVGTVIVVLLGLGFAGATRGNKEDQTLFVTPTDAWSRLEETGPISDFGQMASIALITKEQSESSDYELGRTYLAATTIFLPSAVAPWKLPAAGAVASDRYLPAMFASGTALQTSFPGEGFLNFGWLGVLAAGILFGSLMKGVRRLGRPSSIGAVLLFALVLPRVALLFREDLANVTGFLVLDLVVLVVVLVGGGVQRPWFRSRSSASG
jgi:hypothetical protein